jgi:hypothetical protein
MSTQVTLQGHNLNISAADETATTVVVHGKSHFDDVDACGDVVVDGTVHAHGAVNNACYLESCMHYHAETRDTGTVFFLSRDSDHIELIFPLTLPVHISSGRPAATGTGGVTKLQTPPLHFEVVGSTCSSFTLHFQNQLAESSYMFIDNELVSGSALLSKLQITNALSINLRIQTVPQNCSVLYRLTGCVRTALP